MFEVFENAREGHKDFTGSSLSKKLKNILSK